MALCVRHDGLAADAVLKGLAIDPAGNVITVMDLRIDSIIGAQIQAAGVTVIASGTLLKARIPFGSSTATKRMDGPPEKVNVSLLRLNSAGFTVKRPPGAGKGARSNVGRPARPKKCWKRT